MTLSLKKIRWALIFGVESAYNVLEKNGSEVTQIACFISCLFHVVWGNVCYAFAPKEDTINRRWNLTLFFFVGNRDGFWPIVSCQRCLTAYVTESFIQTDSFEGGMVWD